MFKEKNHTEDTEVLSDVNTNPLTVKKTKCTQASQPYITEKEQEIERRNVCKWGTT